MLAEAIKLLQNEISEKAAAKDPNSDMTVLGPRAGSCISRKPNSIRTIITYSASDIVIVWKIGGTISYPYRMRTPIAYVAC